MSSMFARAPEPRGWRFNVTNPRSPAYWVEKLFGGGGETTASGIRVNADTAMTISAVFAGVRILAEDTGTLPFHVYEQLDPVGSRLAREHPVDTIISRQANPEMGAIPFREAIQGHAALRGNGFAEIQRDQGYRPIALWPLRPDKMQVVRNGRNGVAIAEAAPGALFYKYTLPSGETKFFDPSLIFHHRGFSADGLVGYSIVALARQGMGLTLAAEEFGGRFFGNDARPGVVLQHPGKLSDTAEKHLREGWEERHQGLSNAQRVAILEEGMKLQEVGIPPEDAQFLQTRQFQITEVARWFRLAPHMLSELDRATHSNIEHQGIEHVAFTLRAWGERWESTTDTTLLTPPYFAKLRFDALLRGDTAARYEAYMKGFQTGFLNGDMIAEMEDWNPLPDGQGKKFYVPVNMIPAESFDEHGMTMKDRLTAVAALTKAGFDPASALDALNLPAITHTGRIPNTLQVVDPDLGGS